MTVIEYIRYLIPPDRGEAFVQVYRNAVVPLERSDYCVDYELSQCAEESELFMLRIRWTSIDDHLQKFRSSEQFRQFFSHIRPFVEQIEEMQHYNVILESAASSRSR